MRQVGQEYPWLSEEWLLPSAEQASDEIDRDNIRKYKAEALSDGFARCFSIADNKLLFVSAVPDLPSVRFESFCREMERLSADSTADPSEFMQKTINTSFSFSNDCGMNKSVQALHAMPAKKLDAEKLRVAIVVGQGNFESMTPELLNHAHLVLFVDIDKIVLEHNLFMAKLLQSDLDFTETYLDETKNPLLLNHVKTGSHTAYEQGTGRQVAHYESVEYNSDYLAAKLFSNGMFMFAPFSELSFKLSSYMKGERKSREGGELFNKNDLKEFLRLREVMLADAEYSRLIPNFDKFYKGVDHLVKNKGKVITNREAEQLKLIVDAVVDNRYFISKDQRFNICRTASRELRFASVKINLFDQVQVGKLKDVFEKNNVVVTFANVTNLLYYDNKEPFKPVARADKPWEPQRNLMSALKSLCDLKDTIYFYSTYEKTGSQYLSSHCCVGLIDYAGHTTRNLKMLNSQMVGTQEMARIRDERQGRDQQISSSECAKGKLEQEVSVYKK